MDVPKPKYRLIEKEIIEKINAAKRKCLFSPKYFASVTNIQEFYRAISNALNPDIMRRAVTL